MSGESGEWKFMIVSLPLPLFSFLSLLSLLSFSFLSLLSLNIYIGVHTIDAIDIENEKQCLQYFQYIMLCYLKGKRLSLYYVMLFKR